MPDYTVFSFFAIVTGAIVGLAAVFFHNAIEFLNHLFFDYGIKDITLLGGAAVILVPAAGMLVQSIMIKSAPDTASKRGVSEVIKAVATRGGYIRLRTTLFHFLAPVICIGSGGTVGPEGPAAQLGGGLASKTGQLFGLSDARRRIFTAAGAGAAISAIFNTPLGGIFFALEIVLLNDFQSPTFSALILASVTASAISRILLGNTPAFIFDVASSGPYEQYYLFIILGVLAGLVSLLFIRYTDMLHKLFARKLFRIVPQWSLMIGVGLLVGVCGYFYSDIFGIGYHAINGVLADSLTWKVVLILFAMKFLLVPLVLNSGGFGGTFAPALFMGACFGFLYAFGINSIWGLELNTTTYVLVAMGAMLGGINSIPIASILMIFEMTKDYTFILPLMLAVVISTTIVQVFLKNSVHIKHLEEQGYKIHHGKESRILKSINVSEVMRDEAEIVSQDMPLPRLITQLMESHHSTFYIVDGENKITGAISESELRPIITEYEYLRSMIVANDIARHEVTTVREDDDLDYVLTLFGNRNVEELPVVDKNNPDKIIGTVWKQDVISAYNKESLKYNLTDGLARELKSIKEVNTSRVAEGYSIVERPVPDSFIGKSLRQLRLRNEYELEVLMIRNAVPFFNSGEDENAFIMPDPEYRIQSGDSLVLFGTDDKINHTNEWQ